MRPGSPFKYRWLGRPTPGMLSTPDIVKFKIPVHFAFVPANPNKMPGAKKECCKKEQGANALVSAAQYKINENCQKVVLNLNKCLKNNQNDACNYYRNYLNNLCSLNQ